MSSNALRSLIVSVSAETVAYQREMARASRRGRTTCAPLATATARPLLVGGRGRPINAQNVAMNSLTSSVGAYVSAMAGALAVAPPRGW